MHIQNGNTALHNAAYWGKYAAVKVLTKRGADIHMANKVS